MKDAGTIEWLSTLVVGSPVAIDGIDVWLRPTAGGSELGALLVPTFSEAQLQNALRYAFYAAFEFDAGLAFSVDGGALYLTQWLPGVADWPMAAEPLEKLLNQVEALRAHVDPSKNALLSSPQQVRAERRIREQLEGRIQ